MLIFGLNDENAFEKCQADITVSPPILIIIELAGWMLQKLSNASEHCVAILLATLRTVRYDMITRADWNHTTVLLVVQDVNVLGHAKPSSIYVKLLTSLNSFKSAIKLFIYLLF